jgi:hypothetical protein
MISVPKKTAFCVFSSIYPLVYADELVPEMRNDEITQIPTTLQQEI